MMFLHLKGLVTFLGFLVLLCNADRTGRKEPQTKDGRLVRLGNKQNDKVLFPQVVKPTNLRDRELEATVGDETDSNFTTGEGGWGRKKQRHNKPGRKPAGKPVRKPTQKPTKRPVTPVPPTPVPPTPVSPTRVPPTPVPPTPVPPTPVPPTPVPPTPVPPTPVPPTPVPPTPAPPTPPVVVPKQLYNTGVDENGVALPDNAIDPHYTVGDRDIGVIPNLKEKFPANDEDSATIWELPDQRQRETLTFETTFDLTGYDHTKALITGVWSADDFGLAIRINGVDAGADVLTPRESYTMLHPFTIDSGFVAGENKLEFVVENRGGEGTFRVDDVELTAPVAAG